MLNVYKTIRLTLLILFLLIPFTGYTSSANDLANLLKSVNSMQANFVQTIYDKAGKPIQRSSGRMSLLKPGKLRWEVVKPIPQLVIANEPKLWIFDPDLEQVTIKPLQQVAGETPALLLSHANQVLNKDYQVKQLQQDSPNLLSFELHQKNSGSMFTSVEMSFKNGQINHMRLKDHLGHTTVIQYQNIKTNVKLSESLFVFNPPPHIDIIDESRKTR